MRVQQEALVSFGWCGFVLFGYFPDGWPASARRQGCECVWRDAAGPRPERGYKMYQYAIFCYAGACFFFLVFEIDTKTTQFPWA